MKLRCIGLLLALATCPQAVFADLLARYEAAAEQTSRNLIGFYLSRLPEHADKMPTTEWEAIDREIAVCVLARVEDEKGPDAAENLIVLFESMVTIEVTTFAGVMELMSVQITDATALAALSECGQMERNALRDQESGLMDLVSDPGIAARLRAD